MICMMCMCHGSACTLQRKPPLAMCRGEPLLAPKRYGLGVCGFLAGTPSGGGRDPPVPLNLQQSLTSYREHLDFPRWGICGSGVRWRPSSFGTHGSLPLQAIQMSPESDPQSTPDLKKGFQCVILLKVHIVRITTSVRRIPADKGSIISGSTD